ncbi:MAG: hypothetical protein CL959_01540 [Euryarchaeota archaeon]|nr:hypothetical protein [Euryarchaeota archaeon]|tara:strand:- start:1341 stop:2078 length:738 start_codon:yes stop_codon:yes gene_type:complete
MSEENLNLDVNTGAEAEQVDAAPSTEQDSYSKEEVAKLLKALHSERDARKAQEKALKESASKLQSLEGIDKATYDRLQEESARRAEAEAQFEARELERQKAFEAVRQEAAVREKKLEAQITHMNRHRAFEGLFTAAGGKNGRFLDTAFDQLGKNLRLESDGSFTVIDSNGDPLLDEESGKRVDPKDWVSQYKTDSFLGFTFEPEQGYGSGAMNHPSQRRDSGTMSDFQGLSTSEIFARSFGNKKV